MIESRDSNSRKESPFERAVWSEAEALVRICFTSIHSWDLAQLSTQEMTRAQRLLSDSNATDSSQRQAALPWVLALRKEWPNGVRPQGLHPCVWVRWALSAMGVEASAELLMVFGEWQTKLLYEGKLAVMKREGRTSSESRDGSLSKFGALSGHGTPAHLFVLEPFEHKVAQRSWRMKKYPLPGARVRANDRPSEERRTAAGAESTDSRGRDVTLAVEAAVLTLCLREKTVLSRLAIPRPNGARFEAAEGVTRAGLFKLLKKDERVKPYAKTTVVAVLSGIVSTPRGRPTNRVP